MTGPYRRPPPTGGGLRLHLNENTAGCSPKVLEAIARLSPTDFAFYPDYDDVYRETAAYLGVTEEQLIITNGLDEGLVVAVMTTLQRRGPDGAAPETIIIRPAFEMYAITVLSCGGTVVDVMPRDDFEFPLENVLRAITERTRLVFITSPNNPTGVRITNDDIATVAASVPRDAMVFVDEAYHDFCGDTCLPLIATHANLVVGRTFAKAHGLAALRVGALMGSQAVIGPLQYATPPYSLNVCAAAGLRAALADEVQLRWYVSQVLQSRELVYRFCDRKGFKYWPSGANFVLARVGSDAAALTQYLEGRGIYIRNKSGDYGCGGCIRITTGVVEHTECCLAAMEDYLCGAR
jgi:histidinol-phosphate aminotransferase